MHDALEGFKEEAVLVFFRVLTQNFAGIRGCLPLHQAVCFFCLNHTTHLHLDPQDLECMEYYLYSPPTCICLMAWCL